MLTTTLMSNFPIELLPFVTNHRESVNSDSKAKVGPHIAQMILMEEKLKVY